MVLAISNLVGASHMDASSLSIGGVVLSKVDDLRAVQTVVDQ